MAKQLLEGGKTVNTERAQNFISRPHRGTGRRIFFTGALLTFLCTTGAALWARQPAMAAPSQSQHVAVYASVVRAGTFVVDDQPLEAIGGLRQGDRLRLRFVDTAAAYVKVEGAPAEGAWSPLYRGDLIAGSPLQARVVLGANKPVQLRISLCEKPNTGCTTQHYVL